MIGTRAGLALALANEVSQSPATLPIPKSAPTEGCLSRMDDLRAGALLDPPDLQPQILNDPHAAPHHRQSPCVIVVERSSMTHRLLAAHSFRYDKQPRAGDCS